MVGWGHHHVVVGGHDPLNQGAVFGATRNDDRVSVTIFECRQLTIQTQIRLTLALVRTMTFETVLSQNRLDIALIVGGCDRLQAGSAICG